MRYWKYLPLIALIFTSLSAQEYGYIKIDCDKDGLEIFIDGGEIGISPIHDSVEATVGTHVVSFFPYATLDDLKRARKSLSFYNEPYKTIYKYMNVEAFEAGTKSVYVQKGKTSKVKLSFKKMLEAIEKGRLRARKEAERLERAVAWIAAVAGWGVFLYLVFFH